MSILELIGWLLVACTFVCWLLFMMEWGWCLVCGWIIERERERFWLDLERRLYEKALRARARYVVPDGPYRSK